MSFARKFLVLSYGLFTIAAQTLLFREFLTSLEGNDISVGIFFASWFIWVAVGSLLLYKLVPIGKGLQTKIEFLFLAYLPALLLQIFLTVQARSIFGEPSFALLPIRTILLLSLVVNAPISLITGLLFPLICRWIQQDDSAAISKVYVIEAVGSFLGGLGVTVLLIVGINPIQICFILALLISISILFLHLPKQIYSESVEPNQQTILVRFVLRPAAFLLPVCIIICIAAGVDKKISTRLQTIKWSRLLPADTLAGSFQTSQAEYLYGSYKGQFLSVSQAAVVEALPDDETNGRITAIALCQNPNAKNFLVIGSGLGLCQQILKLKQAESVCWAYCDTEYIQKINSSLPDQLKTNDNRLNLVTGEIRSFLAANSQFFDIVILNLPDATTSVLNRYFTIQFFKQLKNSLRTGGIVAIRISGGENIMGTELINLGASTKLSLGSVFSNLVLTAGSQSWFIASDSTTITGQSGILRDRFQKIDGSDAILPPDALLSIYLPDRAQKALDAYNNADLPTAFLINTDARPLTHLFSLLVSVKQSDAPVTKFVRGLLVSGILIFLIPIIVYIAVRLLYILKECPLPKKHKSKPQQSSQNEYDARRTPHNEQRATTFDSSFLAFSAGTVGIGSCIILMYLYQTQFGSLYLHIGIISSLFMLGLFFGAAFIRFLLEKTKRIKPEAILTAVVCIHGFILAAIAYWPSRQLGGSPAEKNIILDPTHLIFAAAFLICGLCAGAYFPIAAKQLSGIRTGTAAAKLETADHIGASAGSLLTGLLLVPILGTKQSLIIFIILMLANIPPAILKIFRPAPSLSAPKTIGRLTKLGYALFAIASTVVLCSNLVFAANSVVSGTGPSEQTARLLAPNMKIRSASAQLEKDTLRYYKIFDSNEKAVGFIFSSEKLAPDIRGFGGKINLAVFIDPDGRLLDFQIITSNETPEYLELVTGKKEFFKDRPLFAKNPFTETDAVTGATISYNAITSELQISAKNFADQVLGETSQFAESRYTTGENPEKPFDYAALYLAGAAVASLIVIYIGGFRTRLIILLINFLVAGLIFNAQYSLAQITNLLSFNLPAVAFSTAFLIAVAVPILVLIFGNIYCGYLCPFGALQELLAFLTPKKLKPQPADAMRNLSFVKYLLLFIFVIAFFISRKNQSTLSADPLISIFSRSIVLVVIIITAAALAGSLFYTRLWCRTLCPTGAFLCLLNRFSIFKRFLPAKKYGFCEFGITPAEQADCIYCDICRYLPAETAPRSKPPAKTKTVSSYILITIVAATAIFISASTLNKLHQAIPAAFSEPQGFLPTAGQGKNANLQKIQTLIKQNMLSDKEALFYKKIDEQDTQKTESYKNH